MNKLLLEIKLRFELPVKAKSILIAVVDKVWKVLRIGSFIIAELTIAIALVGVIIIVVLATRPVISIDIIRGLQLLSRIFAN